MSEYVIRWDAELRRWSVYRTGEFARYVKSFDTSDEAQAYVDEREPEA